MPAQPTRQPPLKRLASRQKREGIAPLVDQAERDVRMAFAAARAEVAPTLTAFAAAYRAELERVNADRDEDDEPEPRRVPQIWLTTSGWGKRVEKALASAAHKAGQRSMARITKAHDDAALLGQEHAGALLKLAMQPAVDAIVHRRVHRLPRHERRRGRRP